MEEKINLDKFRHCIKNTVKFAEVDSFGVVHNIQYFYMLEWARTEYLKTVGVRHSKSLFIKEFPLMVVHAGIDYFSSASFGDEYEVLTRVAFVKNSSIGFENIIRLVDGNILVKADAILVHLDYSTKLPDRIPDNLRQFIRNYEGENVVFTG